MHTVGVIFAKELKDTIRPARDGEFASAFDQLEHLVACLFANDLAYDRAQHPTPTT